MPKSFLIKKIPGLKQESIQCSTTEELEATCNRDDKNREDAKYEMIPLRPVSDWIHSPPVHIHATLPTTPSSNRRKDRLNSDGSYHEKRDPVCSPAPLECCCCTDACQACGNNNDVKPLSENRRNGDYRPIFLESNDISLAQKAPAYFDFMQQDKEAPHTRHYGRKFASESFPTKRKIDDADVDDDIVGDNVGYDESHHVPKTFSAIPSSGKSIYFPTEDNNVDKNLVFQPQLEDQGLQNRASDRLGRRSPDRISKYSCDAKSTHAITNDLCAAGGESSDFNKRYEAALPDTSVPRSPCPSAHASSMSPISPMSPFSPTAPIPMYFPLSNSSYAGSNFYYPGCSYSDPCCQRLPLYCPPGFLQFRSEAPQFSNGLNALKDRHAHFERGNCSWRPPKSFTHIQEFEAPLHNQESDNGHFKEIPEFQLLSTTRQIKQKKSKKHVNNGIETSKQDETLSSTSSSKTELDHKPSAMQKVEGGDVDEENEMTAEDSTINSGEDELERPKGIKGRKFTCKFCGKVYVSLGALKMHIRTHTLPCKCSICGKAFSRPWLLQGHIRTHTGEKPYKCHLCQRAFADRSNLRAHLQTHSDVKKYCCRTCRKTFSRMSLLLKHEEAGCLVP